MINWQSDLVSSNSVCNHTCDKKKIVITRMITDRIGLHSVLLPLLKEKPSIIGGSVAKAVKSRVRSTTLEAARASETKFTLIFVFFARVFHHFPI